MIVNQVSVLLLSTSAKRGVPCGLYRMGTWQWLGLGRFDQWLAAVFKLQFVCMRLPRPTGTPARPCGND